MDNRADIIKLQDKLTGALIGLARATEGNMHRVSEATAKVVMEALSGTVADDGFDKDTLAKLLRRAGTVGRRDPADVL